MARPKRNANVTKATKPGSVTKKPTAKKTSVKKTPVRQAPVKKPAVKKPTKPKKTPVKKPTKPKKAPAAKKSAKGLYFYPQNSQQFFDLASPDPVTANPPLKSKTPTPPPTSTPAVLTPRKAEVVFSFDTTASM
jgi:hypothetical protein